jgi:hypothetical protein
MNRFVVRLSVVLNSVFVLSCFHWLQGPFLASGHHPTTNGSSGSESDSEDHDVDITVCECRGA